MMRSESYQQAQSDAVARLACLFLAGLSPDVAGELLRELTFVGEGYGCYSTFEVRDGAVQWGEESRRKFWLQLEDPNDDEASERALELAGWGEGYTYTLGPVVVNVCWYWDGDGCLAFQVRGPDFERVVENTDCKKSYGWNEIGVT
jgi:hypothetical protein